MGAILSFVGFLTLAATAVVLLGSVGISVMPFAHQVVHFGMNLAQNFFAGS